MKKRFTLLSVVVLFIFQGLNAQNNFWTKADESALKTRSDLFAKNFKPTTFLAFKLDEAALRLQLTNAPSEKTVAAGKSNFIISVPDSKGKIETYKVVEASVMEPGLAAKFPNIKSYVGQGIEEPSSTIRFDVTPEGFHGMILSPLRKTIYINPVDKVNHIYIVFDRDAADDQQKTFDCKTDQIVHSITQGSTGRDADDGKLRIYRFAVASGGEFSAELLDGTETSDPERKAKVLAGLVTDLTRIDGIMEADFGIRLDYVNNEDTIIFIDGSTDPFLSNPSGYSSWKWNQQSQKALDSIIGKNNYDIGHLLMGYGTGGNAGCIGCVCNDNSKGSGVTGFDTPTGDPFVVDFWIHEIGHQFGANHTFDFGYEGSGTQMEPGSGSTIMGYAGTTGQYDVQPHSDPYFHAVSINQITDYTISGFGSACSVVTSLGNNSPTVDAGSDYIIPSATPFILTGQGTDADVADVLTYCWEQYDSYIPGSSNAFPKATSRKGPVFRTFNPSLLMFRVFPVLNSILNGSNKNKWEVLPSVARDLNFRLTIRDNHAGDGNNKSDDMKVTVDGASGPFKVTNPNTFITLHVADSVNVMWDVANSDQSPVNCSEVNILLSTDGGLTFTTILAANTLNDGSEKVVIPNILSSLCRIKVESVGNIFFDISNANFTIDAALPVTWLSFSAEKINNSVLLKWSTASEISNDHFDVERSSNSINFSTLGSVAAGTNPNTVQNYTYTDIKTLNGDNFYRLKQVDKDGHFKYSAVVQVNMAGALWTVFPNPATSKTTIQIRSQLTNVSITLSDNAGKNVYSNKLPLAEAGRFIDIPLNNLSKGIYILKIQSDKGSKTDKIIVQ